MELRRSNPFYDVVSQTRASLQSLQAMQTKFERDYLPFYEALSNTYKTGPTKKAADEATRMVERVTVLLDRMIQSGAVTPQDTTALYGLIDDLEEKRQFFIQQSAEVRALDKRLQEVTKETGVGLEDLSVQPEVARRAVRQDVRRVRGQALATLGGQFPRTRQMGARVLGGVGAAALGPFQPLLRMGVGVGRDILGVAGAVARAVREARQARFGAQLHPVARGAPEESLERLMDARGRGPAVTGFRGFRERRVSVEQQTLPLRHFFQKGAYRAKWTKELLQGMKDIARGRRGGGGVADLTQKFKDMGLAMVPFLGKAGLYGAMAVGVALSIKKFKELGSAIDDFVEAQKQRLRAAKALAKATYNLRQKLKEPGKLEEVARARGLTPTQYTHELVFREQQAALQAWAARPWWQKTTDFWLRRKQPELQPFYEGVREIEAAAPPGQNRLQDPVGVIPTTTPENELSSSINRLIDTLGQKQYDSLPSAGVGDPFDSGDSLTRALSDGNLTTGE